MVAFTILLGSLGGLIFFLVGLPLPWLLGPLFFSTVMALASLPVYMPQHSRSIMTSIVGVMVGTHFVPSSLNHLNSLAPSLIGLFIFLTTGGAISFVIFRQLGRFDKCTAFFAAVPGGIVEMATLGGQNGGDERLISLVQATRVLTVVSVLAPCILFATATAPTVSEDVPPLDVVVSSDVVLLSGLGNMTILILIALIGSAAAKLLRFPTPFLMGPLLTSGVLHGSGAVELEIPSLALICAQIVLGTSLGIKFKGYPISSFYRALRVSILAAFALLLNTILFSIFVSQVLNLSISSVVVAYSPAGLTEMTLIAHALNLSIPIVAVHHLFRMLIVFAGAPLLYRILFRR